MTAIRHFSATEKVVFTLFVAAFSVSALVMAWNVNKSFLLPVPAHGGVINEGVIGSPRFINPILALSDVDRDLTSLVYSGLLKAENDELVPDLAQSYTISEDGLTYTFTLRDDIYFHDNTPITADDVVFTIQKAQDAVLKSPRRANWDGVTVEKTAPNQITFTLKKPYAPFIENTTMGILPRHIWKNVDVEQFTFSQFNVEPIGSGPYELKNIERDSGGLPQSYTLVPFKKYVGGEPYVKSIVIHFYPNEKLLGESYSEGIIEAMNGISPQAAQKLDPARTSVLRSPLPRVFGIFFNQNQAPVFSHKEVRQAINMVIDRDRIVEEVLGGYGTPINGPMPSGILSQGTTTPEEIAENSEERKAAAVELLEENGWAINSEGVLEKKGKNQTEGELLQFSLSTSNAPELKQAAEIIKEELAAIGAVVTVRIFESGDLNQNVIRPRKYDALLFGEIIGRDLDLFAFWHSSQRNDPGLNIAMYTNSKVDKLLEDARTIADREERLEKYRQAEEAINADVPAVFLYSPDFIYALPTRVKGVTLDHITTPSDRFDNVNSWYIHTDHVWKIFVNN